MTQTPAGWYPVDGGQERYWDGVAWTAHQRPVGVTAPPPPPQAPYQPPVTSHTARNVLIVMFVLVILLFGGCLAVVVGATKSIRDDAGKAHDVTYVVSGTASTADLTYNTDGLASMSQQQGVALPWTKQLQVKGSVLRIYELTAQSGGTGTISCEIKVDGRTVKKATSSGQYAVASCTYTKGE